ncbi:MAG: low molecular weight phosphatase family protein [Dehalococcoidaceae bacterium]|nr:low molecular weight phosphatase family protein [Dehalococcoidaceae bacterium]|tara:strand:- start:28 stop:423 length:396 start_codon:yes stop_codon:yes gene_type:complete
MTSILFVCIENSNRSQLAEAYMKKHASTIKSYSAGSKPIDKINLRAQKIINQLNINNVKFYPKTFTSIISEIDFDYIISMGCGEQCPQIAAKNRIEWEIPDPKLLNDKEYYKIAQLIEVKVINLIDQITNS